MRELLLAACVGIAPMKAKHLPKMLPPTIGYMVRADNAVYWSTGTQRGSWSKIYDCEVEPPTLKSSKRVPQEIYFCSNCAVPFKVCTAFSECQEE